jgi:hypothetical protein
MAIVGHDANWSVGTAVGKGAAVLFGHFLPLMAAALVAASPSWLTSYGLRAIGIRPGYIAWQIVASWLTASIIQVIVTIVLVYGAVQALRGRPVSIVNCLLEGAKRMAKALIVGVLATVGTAVGFVLLVVPGFFFDVLWAVVVPVATIEGIGIAAAFGRSVQLTDGRRWRVLGVMLSLMLVAGAIWLARTLLVVQFVPTILGSGSVGIAAFGIVNWIITTVGQAFSACVVATLYYYLRREKEGVQIDQIAAVFD